MTPSNDLDLADDGWDLPAPFIRYIQVHPDDIDDFQHANNAAFLKWADQTGWAHWEADGYTRSDCNDSDRGMAIVRTEADYMGHCRADETIACAVWIARSDGKLRAERWYQFRRVSDGATVFRAITKLVCFQISTGRPARMTGAFAKHYAKPEQSLTDAADLLLANLKR